VLNHLTVLIAVPNGRVSSVVNPDPGFEWQALEFLLDLSPPSGILIKGTLVLAGGGGLKVVLIRPGGEEGKQSHG